MTDCVCDSACNVLQTAAAAPHAACGWAPSANPPCLLLGVLASDVRLAVRALRDFCAALGSDFLLPEPDVRPPSLASPQLLNACQTLALGLLRFWLAACKVLMRHARVNTMPPE